MSAWVSLVREKIVFATFVRRRYKKTETFDDSNQYSYCHIQEGKKAALHLNQTTSLFRMMYNCSKNRSNEDWCQALSLFFHSLNIIN